MNALAHPLTGSADGAVLQLAGASVTYPGARPVEALRPTDLVVRHGDYAAIQGRSGSGKSTLLAVMGLLARPTTGSVTFEGQDTDELGEREAAAVRGGRIGFVFQSFHLVGGRTILEQVALPLLYRRTNLKQRAARAAQSLGEVGLSGRLEHTPAQLSGGERQRVAIARALVNDPALLLADEPTGSLDAVTGDEVLALFAQLHARGRTIVMVTHDPAVAAGACRQLVMHDGTLTEGPAG